MCFLSAVSAPWYEEREKAGTEREFSIPTFVELALGRALLCDRTLTPGLEANLASNAPVSSYG